MFPEDHHMLKHSGCVMHMLCQRHIFVEVAPDIFRNNRHSYELRSETGAAPMVLIEYASLFTCEYFFDVILGLGKDTKPVWVGYL